MITRRAVLATLGCAGATAVVGCADTSDTGKTPSLTAGSTNTPTRTAEPVTTPAGHVSPTDAADPAPVPSCADPTFERLRSWVDGDVVWGTFTDDGPVFALRTSMRRVPLGDPVEITLRNISDSTRTTGNLHKSNVSLLTEEGWIDVRGWADGEPRPITDDVWEFEPGEGYTWAFPLTEDGVTEMSYPNHRDALAVCPSLQPGRYRFATAAVGDPRTSLAVAFDVTG